MPLCLEHPGRCAPARPPPSLVSRRRPHLLGPVSSQPPSARTALRSDANRNRPPARKIADTKGITAHGGRSTFDLFRRAVLAMVGAAHQPITRSGRSGTRPVPDDQQLLGRDALRPLYAIGVRGACGRCPPAPPDVSPGQCGPPRRPPPRFRSQAGPRPGRRPSDDGHRPGSRRNSDLKIHRRNPPIPWARRYKCASCSQVADTTEHLIQSWRWLWRSVGARGHRRGDRKLRYRNGCGAGRTGVRHQACSARHNI